MKISNKNFLGKIAKIVWEGKEMRGRMKVETERERERERSIWWCVKKKVALEMASKFLLIVVFIFDVIAFGLAVAAEQRRSTAKIVQDAEMEYNYCVYDSDIATGFGVGAFLFLLASQVLIMVASRCFCCGKALNPGGSRAWAVVLFIVCWVFFIIAEACVFAGSIQNAYHTKYRTIFGGENLSCETLRKGVFAAGAAFILFTAIVSEFYYVSYSKAMGSFGPYGKETGAGMGGAYTSA